MKLLKTYLAHNQKSVPGIYGGMGPMAHIYFEQLLIEESKHQGHIKDQDHPVWITLSGTSTPDRTQSLEGSSAAYNHLLYFCQTLEHFGADFIIMTCNTAHAYKNSLQKEISIPIVSIIELTAKYIAGQYPTIEKVGLLATSGTLQMKLYQKELKKYGIKVISPAISSEMQEKTMNAIYHPTYGIKATGSRIFPKAKKDLQEAAIWCKKQGSEAIIAGCTEISLVLNNDKFEQLPVINPLKIAAKKVISHTFGSAHQEYQSQISELSL